MSDGKIYIYVTGEPPASSGGATVDNGGATQSKTNDKNLLTHWAKDKIISTTKNIATTSINYSLSNIGNFTGDYITQAHVNDCLKALGTLESIGGSALAGAMIGGPIGAVLGASIGLINATVSNALAVNTQRIMNNKMNYEIAQLRSRAGLNTTLDGSRGTEN